MSTVYLKVKVKNLAEEAHIIRFEERRAREKRDVELNRYNHIKANKYQVLFNGLNEHRKTVVREEQRATNIAYAFLRGRAFGEVEHGTIGLTLIPLTYGECNPRGFWSRVGRMIAKYGNGYPTYKGFLAYDVLHDWVAGKPVNRPSTKP